MTCRLILIRHAKSSWDDPLHSDHDRPLNARGRDAADRVGIWLAAQGHLPQAALVSSARRTCETWERIAQHLPQPPAPRILPALYAAQPAVMLRALRDAPAPTVALLGHNPGIAAFAALLLRHPPDHPRFADYPTAATLVAEFAIDDWAALTPASGTAVAFTVPRDLPPPPG